MEQTVGSRPPGAPGEGTSDKAGQAKEQVQDKAREVAGKAQEGAGQAREKVREQVDERSTQAGERVRSAAGDARSVAEELRRQGKEAPARYTEQAAERAERLGDYLHDADGDRLLRDMEEFARRNPWAVVAGGVVLGFTASRLLKASSADRYRQGAGYRTELVSGGQTAGNGSGATPAVGGGPGRFDR
jgi:uncharacterized protein YjbJ (UPF0337 family)